MLVAATRWRLTSPGAARSLEAGATARLENTRRRARVSALYRWHRRRHRRAKRHFRRNQIRVAQRLRDVMRQFVGRKLAVERRLRTEHLLAAVVELGVIQETPVTTPPHNQALHSMV